MRHRSVRPYQAYSTMHIAGEYDGQTLCKVLVRPDWLTGDALTEQEMEDFLELFWKRFCQRCVDKWDRRTQVRHG